MIISDSPAKVQCRPFLHTDDILKAAKETRGECHAPFLYRDCVMANTTLRAYVLEPTATILPHHFRMRTLPLNQLIACIDNGRSQFVLEAKHLQCLDGDEFINDDVVNSYFALLELRSKLDQQYPATVSMSTHFFTTFRSCDSISKSCRWLRKAMAHDCDLCLFPVNVPTGVHWFLAAADFRTYSVTTYNSAPMHATLPEDKDIAVVQRIAVILDAFLDACQKQQTTLRHPRRPWNIQAVHPPAVPPQIGDVACAVYTACTADWLSAGRPTADLQVAYCHSCMPRLRSAWRQFFCACRPKPILSSTSVNGILGDVTSPTHPPAEHAVAKGD